MSGAKHGEPGHVRHDTACYGCAMEALGLQAWEMGGYRIEFTPGYVIPVALDTHDRMVSMLRKLEWSAVDHRDMQPRCPECDRVKPIHSQVCELEALLDEIGRNP